jgi:low affinity Fe/Cu permease
METLISSIITGIVAITTCLITQGMANKRTTALIEYKIEELLKKIDLLDKVSERVYKLESQTELQDVKINSLIDKVAELERKHE